MSKPLPPRHYWPIWYALKTKGTCTVEINSQLHKRTIKAVVKEKYYDQEFNQHCKKAQQRFIIKTQITGNQIKFILRKRISLGDL